MCSVCDAVWYVVVPCLCTGLTGGILYEFVWKPLQCHKVGHDWVGYYGGSKYCRRCLKEDYDWGSDG
jgi:hypothetical protein